MSLIDLALAFGRDFEAAALTMVFANSMKWGGSLRVTASLKCLIFCKFPEKKYSGSARKLLHALVLSDIQGPVDASMALAFLEEKTVEMELDAMSTFWGNHALFADVYPICHYLLLRRTTLTAMLCVSIQHSL